MNANDIAMKAMNLRNRSQSELEMSQTNPFGDRIEQEIQTNRTESVSNPPLPTPDRTNAGMNDKQSNTPSAGSERRKKAKKAKKREKKKREKKKKTKKKHRVGRDGTERRIVPVCVWFLFLPFAVACVCSISTSRGDISH